mgnify:FL=1
MNNMIKTVDLHTHSTFSDGTFSPAELVKKTVEKNLAAFALTDHDAVGGIESAITAIKEQNAPVLFVPGTELSVGYKDGDIHIVGLFIDYKNPAFTKISDLLVSRRVDRNKEMVAKFNNASINMTYEELQEGNPDTVITRAHFARWLIKHGIVKNATEAFDKYLDTHCPFYVPRKYITPEEGIELILESGGVPILAHPLHYKLEEKELETLIVRLKAAGLKGMEAKYSNHTAQDETYARKLCNKYELLPSGGSDFHGSNKPAIDMGTGRGTLSVPFEYLVNIAKAAKPSEFTKKVLDYAENA